MRPLRSLILYAGAVFVGGALLAPWLHHLAQWAAEDRPALRKLAETPFHRFATRSMLLIALLGLWPFLQSLGVRSWASAGFVARRDQGAHLRVGLALGVASLGVMIFLALAFNARRWDAIGAGQWVGKLPGLIFTALLVAFLEELLFRGALFRGLRETHGWKTALAVSSAVYALVHFFQKAASPAHVTWHSGLDLLPRMFAGLGEWETAVPAFIALTLAGATLALAFHRTGNLWFSIGLHAGWVFCIGSNKLITDGAPDAAARLWGTGRFYDGWFAPVVMMLVAGAVWKLTPAPRATASIEDRGPVPGSVARTAPLQPADPHGT